MSTMLARYLGLPKATVDWIEHFGGFTDRKTANNLARLSKVLLGNAESVPGHPRVVILAGRPPAS